MDNNERAVLNKALADIAKLQAEIVVLKDRDEVLRTTLNKMVKSVNALNDHVKNIEAAPEQRSIFEVIFGKS